MIRRLKKNQPGTSAVQSQTGMATGTIGKAIGTETTEAIVTAEARTEGTGTTATGMTEVPEKTGTRAGVAAMTGTISVTAPTTKIDTSEVTSTEVTVEG